MKNIEHAFVNECVDDHWEDIIEAIENGHGYAATTIDAVCGWVEIVSGRRGYSSVTVHHEDEENQRKCPRLCEAIEKALPSWAEVIVMTNSEYIRLTAQIAVLKEVAIDYSGQTIDNIINQLESRTETCNNLGNKQK